jgi:DNA primase
MGRLEDLISRDFSIEGNGRWLRTREHNSLVIDSEEQMFYWNSQGIFGNIYIWLTKIKGYSNDQAKEYLRNLEKYQDTFVSVLNGKKEEVLVYPKLVDIFYENGKRNSREYWYKRGISDQSIDMFRLGYFEGWYMVPIFMDGTFKNFQMRREDPKRILPWYRSLGPLLFNSEILKLVDRVYITEGPLDCITMVEHGFPAVSHNAGSEYFSTDWFKYFIRQKEIFVLYDNDSAGEKGVEKVVKVLGESRCKIYTFGGYSKGFDPCDFFAGGGTKEELNVLMEKNAKFLMEI